MRGCLFMCFLLLGMKVNAQLDGFSIQKTNNQQLIEEAVRGGLFLLRQDYQLKDTVSGKYYGRGGDVFGSIYALGVKLRGGYCLADRGIHPWEYDVDFNEYRSTYMPVMYKIYRREMASAIMTECPVWEGKQVRELVSGKFSFVEDSLFRNEGFDTDLTAGKKAGWFVWVVSNKAVEEATFGTEVSYTIYRKKLDIRENVGEYAIDAPSTNQKVWGGIYVEPVQTAVGQITFRLIGVVDKQENQWTMFTPFGKLPVAVTNSISGGKKEVLTPVERKEGTEVVGEENENDRKEKDDMKEKNKKSKK